MTYDLTENMVEFMDTLSRFGGTTTTRTLTSKGYTQDQLRYRQDNLAPDYITVDTIKGKPGEQVREWTLTDRGEYVLDKWKAANGEPATDSESAAVELTRGELRDIQNRIRDLEDEVARLS